MAKISGVGVGCTLLVGAEALLVSWGRCLMGRRWGGGEGLDRGGGMGMMLGRWMVGGRFSFF